MRKAIAAACIALTATPAFAQCAGGDWRCWHLHNHEQMHNEPMTAPSPPPAVVLPCRMTPMTDGEKVGAFFRALGGVIERECDPATMAAHKRQQDEHDIKMQIMREQLRHLRQQGEKK